MVTPLATLRHSGFGGLEVANQRFAIAVAASLVAHGLILFAVPGLLDPSRSKLIPPAKLVARLAQVLPPVEPPRPVEKVREPKEEPVRPAPSPALSARPILTAPATPSAPAQVQAAAESPRTAEPVQSAPSAPVAKAEPTSAAPAVPTAGDAADPATVGQYRIAVIAAARRYKRYPRIALDNNWEGTAEVRMIIGADGNIVSISLKTKSGFEVLDQQALEMIRRAKPQAPIPASLRGKGFTIDVPVVFSLKEEG